MKRLIILGAVCVLVTARPELYKEKEDFQYSRSSSDEGSKSGYYGAQRGNMGGNYERAHNMDSLAQNQMSGLVRQVEGELGDGANTRQGSVYTSAKSRGTYGSGHYDLSNLAGRNFQEGASYDDSHASSLTSSAYNGGYANSRHQSSRHSGYQTAGHSNLNMHADDLQAIDNTQGSSLYGTHSSHSSGYQAQSGFKEHREYGLSNADTHSGYGSNAQTRLISATPVRIIVRPGGRVAVPIAAQTYDAAHDSSSVDQNSLSTGEIELLNNGQRAVYRPGTAKHYESSYNYRKEWEKHDTVPSVIPLPTPTVTVPVNSELYEDKLHTSNSQYDASRYDSQRAHSSNMYNYNTNVKSAGSHSRSDYDSHHTSAADSASNAYTLHSGNQYAGSAANSNSLRSGYETAGSNVDLNSQVEAINSRPKSYQSSYSYHKSWERQGDPYVIKPASGAYYDGQSYTKNSGSSSRYQQEHSQGVNCDDICGHTRVARSYNADQYEQQSQNLEDLGQQVEDLTQNAQQVSWDQHEAGQQTQNSWDNLESFNQQSQNPWEKLEDLGQQTQQSWSPQETQQNQHSWDKLEDLSQHTSHLEDFGQQVQETQRFDQQTQSDLGQHIQEHNKHELEIPPGVDQQAQFTWPSHKNDQELEKVNERNDEQQTQTVDIPKFKFPASDSHKESDTQNEQKVSVWDKLDNFGSHHHETQHEQHNFEQQEGFDAVSHKESDNQNEQKVSVWDKLDSFGSHHHEDQNEQHNFEQQEGFDAVSHKENDTQNEQKVNVWDKLDSFGSHHHEAQKEQQNFGSHHHQDQNNQHNFEQQQGFDEQQTQTVDVSKFKFPASESHKETDTQNSHQVNVWDKLDNIGSHHQEDQNEQHNFEQQEGFNGDQFSQQTHNSWSAFDSTSHQQSQSNYYESHHSSNTYSDQHQQHHGYNGFNPINEYKSPDYFDFQNHHNQFDIETHKHELTNANSHTSNFDATSPSSNSHPLSTLWNKLDSIEKVSLTKPYEVEQTTTTTQRSYVRTTATPTSTVQQQTHEILQRDDKRRPHHVERGDIGEDNDKKRRPQDVGRGDVSDSYEHKPTGEHATYDHKNDKANQANDLSVVGIEQTNKTNKIVSESQTSKHKVDQHSFGHHEIVEQQNLQNFGQQSQQDFGHQNNFEQQNMQGFDQQNMQDFEQQNVQSFGQQHPEEFTQQNLQDFAQQNFEQQNAQELEQQNLQDFGEQKLQDFGQQNLQDFGEQKLQNSENIQGFDQQNVQDFGQQNLQDFGEQKLQDFGQQTIPVPREQKLQDFSQLSVKPLEPQNPHSLALENYHKRENLQVTTHNKNLETVELAKQGKENEHNFEQLQTQDQQQLQNFDQLQTQDEQQLQNFDQLQTQDQQQLQNFDQLQSQDQQHLQNFDQLQNQDQQQWQSFGREANLQSHQQGHDYFHEQQKLINAEQHSQDVSQLHSPAEKESKSETPVEEPQLVQKQKKDLLVADKPVAPVEPVTQKPGFWTRAKSKISSWFGKS